MAELYYIDFKTTPLKGDPGQPGSGTLTLPVVSRLVAVLHGAFRQMPGRYALAFPAMREGDYRHPGHIIRVFMRSRDEADELLEAIEQHHIFRDHCSGLARVKRVPEAHGCRLLAYMRFRIPNRKSNSTKVRVRKLNESESLPYIKFVSRSTGFNFSLHVQVHELQEQGEFLPNSYGVATRTKMFALPDLPVS